MNELKKVEFSFPCNAKVKTHIHQDCLNGNTYPDYIKLGIAKQFMEQKRFEDAVTTEMTFREIRQSGFTIEQNTVVTPVNLSLLSNEPEIQVDIEAFPCDMCPRNAHAIHKCQNGLIGIVRGFAKENER
jgi:hypothetical protein